MSQLKFSGPRVAALTCPEDKKQAFFWDSSTVGLGVRVGITGEKAYIHQSKQDGKTIRTTIGSTNTWGLDAAQKKAREIQTQIDNGIDPRQIIQERKQTAKEQAENKVRQAITLGELWPLYIEDRKHRWGDLSLRDHQNALQAPNQPLKRTKGVTIAAPLYALSNCRLADLTPDRIQKWLKTENQTRPCVTSKCFRLLRAFLNWCEEDDNPYRGIAPQRAHSAKRVREEVAPVGTKDDCLQKEMLQSWFKAVRELHNPIMSAFLQILLLTGARVSELKQIEWTDVSFEWKTLTIGDKISKKGMQAELKGNARRTIPLTPYAAQLLMQLPRRNSFVFSSLKAASGRITDPNAALSEVIAKAGLPHMSVHGLRRSFGTLSEWVEVPLGIVAQIEGRSASSIVEKHYRRRPIDLLRKWHIKIEEWILKEADVQVNETSAYKQTLRIVA